MGMRIVCDGCEAKYNIADDKVGERPVKLRCKKCSRVIVVRPDAPWHVMIDDAQVGPMTAAEVEQRFAANELDGESYAWREGMDEWQPLASVDAFAHLRGSRMRGERNESSVLFSLGTLDQLARPAATSAPGNTEGSGLLDIKSMASAYLGSAKRAAPSAPAPVAPEVPTSFTAAAVIVPMAPLRGSRPTFLYAMFGAVGVLTIAIVVLVAVILRGNADASTPPPTPTPVVVAPKPPAVAQIEVPHVDTPKVAPPVEAPKAVDTTKKAVETTKKTIETTKKTIDTMKKTDVKMVDTTKKTEPTTCEEIDCVMNGYAGDCCRKFKPVTGVTETNKSELPADLDASLIQKGVSAIAGKAQACGGRSSAKGKVKVHVKVAASGAVTAVSVSATPDAALSDCVVAAMQRATFAPTQHGGSFAYPFSF
jgi:predicted Zn finger-like uncharacterized protein